MLKKTRLIHCYYCGHDFSLDERAVDIDKNNNKTPYEHIRCSHCLSTRNTYYYTSEKKLFAGEMRLISPAPETPLSSEGVSAGGNNLPITRQKRFVMSWLCIKSNRCTSVAPGALMEPQHGWICDWCGSWTFGDDDSHRPLGLQLEKTKRDRRT